MNGVNAIGLNERKSVCRGEVWMNKIEIDAGRVATWTLIFTNTFFVTYFFAKLFQLV
jgi:hypothetical protein